MDVSEGYTASQKATP